MKSYDLAIIGSGPGGYVAGLYASRHKLKVCVIEKDLAGGTCLNRGCIPTKSLINSASIVSTVKNSAIHGVDIQGYKIDFPKMVSRKNDVVLRLRTGIETLLKASSVDLIRGRALLAGPNTVNIDGGESVSAKNILIASGSRTSAIPGIDIDETDILSSDGALNLKALPESLVIIGGGVIGCEFACLFNVLGVKVTIVELMDRLVPSQSREASRKLEAALKKSGIQAFTSSRVESVGKGKVLTVKISGGKSVSAEKLLVAAGRHANTEFLGLDKLGISIEKGKIAVNEFLETNVLGIYAIGDCVAGPLLAHKASYDGMVACDNILGKKRRAEYSNIPSCIWTSPEIASVGMSEEEAKAAFSGAKAAKFPYLASGKAFLLGQAEGFAKIIGNSDGTILGVEIFGKGACELISEAVLAKTLGVNIKDWARVVHGHPTLSEMLQEAAHVFCGEAIHSV